MNNKSKDHAYSHDENRYKICLLRFNKTKNMIKIEEALKEKMNDFLNINYDDKRFPAALCSSCKFVY